MIPQGEYLVVDAACSGNPGPVEYRGVLMPSRRVYFAFGPFYGTNNHGEFLAIVHGLAQMKKDGINLPIYSDSQTALSWVKKTRCGTMWEEYGSEMNTARRLVERGLSWLQTHEHQQPIKWNTREWGEIPADYGRK